METKHTPGPWGTKREYSHGPVIILGGDGKPVVVCREKRDPEEYEANVLLMSAAPELLEALLNIVPRFEKAAKALGNDEWAIKEATAQANAAIAKAIGVK